MLRVYYFHYVGLDDPTTRWYRTFVKNIRNVRNVKNVRMSRMSGMLIMSGMSRMSGMLIMSGMLGIPRMSPAKSVTNFVYKTLTSVTKPITE